ncbi:MAG: DegT/DnrJ/EryC1/StrS family aminotransferase [Anaerovoracaceae bacterium]
MQFIDLHKQFEQIEDKVRAGMDKVYEHKRFIMGPEIKELEERLAEYTGVKHVIACASGTDALTLPLMAKNLTKTDAIFVPSFTFFASAESVTLAGGTPVFVDSNVDTFNLDVTSLEETIKKTLAEGKLTPRGIIAVDLFGQPADHLAIQKIADDYNLFLLEDAAQGFGGEINGKKAGSFGEVAATSFFPAKPLGCYGDGGAIFTNDDALAELIHSVHIHGQGSDKYDNVRIGLNSRLDTMQAVVLNAKMEIFPDEVIARNEVAAEYSRQLAGVIKTPVVPEGYTSSWAQYTLTAKSEEQRTAIIEGLQKKDIPVMIYYPIPAHQSTAYKAENKDLVLPVCEKLSKTVFSLPMHPYLTKEEITMICDAVKEIING